MRNVSKAVAEENYVAIKIRTDWGAALPPANTGRNMRVIVIVERVKSSQMVAVAGIPMNWLEMHNV